MAKLIQICASQNDLFGLDGDGMVHQYNFSTNTWMSIGRGRSDDGESSLVENTRVFGHPNSHGGVRRDAGPPSGDASEAGPIDHPRRQ
jgi:hypothetical protein